MFNAHFIVWQVASIAAAPGSMSQSLQSLLPCPSHFLLPLPTVKRLEWHVDERFHRDVLFAHVDAYDQFRDNLQVDCMDGEKRLTRTLCTKAGVSADAMVQLAIQLAHDKVHNQPAATSKSCSTAAFKHGRSETIRPATLATRHFLELVRLEESSRGPPALTDDLLAAIHQCSKTHVRLVREAAAGQGWDSHLLALKHFADAEALALPLPQIFTDPNYARINDVILSTNTFSSPAVRIGAFAPTSPNGYGICYSITDDGCRACVTSWRDSHYSKGAQFVDALRQSLRRVACVLRG
uniref:Carn_acyltransf domain-containing protein n=2 Tax=Mesocestoides corti TaxID=53468 RepID=A0A5K3EXG6_MESCO